MKKFCHSIFNAITSFLKPMPFLAYICFNIILGIVAIYPGTARNYRAFFCYLGFIILNIIMQYYHERDNRLETQEQITLMQKKIESLEQDIKKLQKCDNF